MRAFIAVKVPEEVKQQALQIKEKLLPLELDIKWVEYENYHITLKFLGEINQQQLENIKEKLAAVSQVCAPFQLSSSKIGFFPNLRRPRVMWLGINGDLGKAYYLGQNIDKSLQELGFAVDKKRSFHLTLGRLRSERNLSALPSKVSSINSKIAPHAFEIKTFSLMESQLSSAGPHYKEIETFTLL